MRRRHIQRTKSSLLPLLLGDLLLALLPAWPHLHVDRKLDHYGGSVRALSLDMNSFAYAEVHTNLSFLRIDGS